MLAMKPTSHGVSESAAASMASNTSASRERSCECGIGHLLPVVHVPWVGASARTIPQDVQRIAVALAEFHHPSGRREQEGLHRVALGELHAVANLEFPIRAPRVDHGHWLSPL